MSVSVSVHELFLVDQGESSVTFSKDGFLSVVCLFKAGNSEA